MTRDEIIRMARKAGMTGLSLIDIGYLQPFANLVAAHEREECAKACDEVEATAEQWWESRADPCDQGRSRGASECAAAIRARGET